jgi:hypothetical protein
MATMMLPLQPTGQVEARYQNGMLWPRTYLDGGLLEEHLIAVSFTSEQL